MLTLFTGKFEDLLPAQREAIHQLTVRRYVADIYHLHTHLRQFEELTPDTPEFERVYAMYFEQIEQALSRYDGRTYLAAILLSDELNNWYALGSMRYLKGQRDEVAVSRSIGQADSSIPTHTLLGGFQYPKLHDFDPDSVMEREISEVSRLVVADQEQIERVICSGLLSPEELQSIVTSTVSEMIVSFYRAGNPGIQVDGLIFNVKPKLAAMLKLRKGIKLVPLFTHGVEPTPLALSRMPDRLYFEQWHSNLFGLIPEKIKLDGTLAAIKYLAERDSHEWVDCEISLPYLVVINSEYERSIENLERQLARHHAYEFHEKVNYG
jgi:hypothetical protein